MRRFLSRVEDVFQIAERGCVVTPGISWWSDSRIKIGDRVWLTRPDGSEINTVVRGIELGGHNPGTGIPILVGSELTKDDIPVGTHLSVEFVPVETILIHAESEAGPIEIAAVFSANESRELQFGWSGRSRLHATLADLQSSDVEFVDYIMEGFVPYHIHAGVSGPTLTLTISTHGSNRDQFIESQICRYLCSAGLKVTSTERRTNSCTGAADPDERHNLE